MEKKDYPMVLTAENLSQILGISKRVAYEIMDETGFPLIRIRRSKYVNREDFFNWLERKKEKKVIWTLTRTLSKERIKGNKLRPKILERDNYQCVLCGSKENLEVHHMQALVYGGESSRDNLITLCFECHTYAPEDGAASNKRFLEGRNKFVYEEMMKSPDINQMVAVAYMEFLKSRVNEYVEKGFITKENAQKVLEYEQNKIF